MSITLLANLANASSTFESEPANLESLKQTISKSLVAVTCQVPTIGYSEDVALTDNDKNNGRNSFIVTSYRNLLPCIQNRNIPVTVTYKGQSYKAEVWGWSVNPDDDLASVMTSVIVPPINDWSNYRPQKNWWLLYVQWGEGALLSNPKIPEPVFSSTRIFAVRDQEFTFSVSPGPFKLGLMKYGLFFDVEGKFVGSLRWKWDDDPASVTGFPRICTVAGGSSNDRSLLNCNSTREKLWGKIAPNPTQTSTPSPRPSPTPSPSISAIDASVEAYDAFKAALESYNLVREAKNDCLKAYRSSDTSISRILNLVSGSRNCSSQDVLVNAAYQRLLSLDPAKSTVKDSLVLIDRLNDVTDQFNNFAEALDEGIVFAEELRDSANDLEEVEALIEVLGTLSSSIETVLERLPSKIKNSLYLKTEVATFIDLNNEFLETSEEFTDALSQFSGSLDVDFEALEKFKLSIALASRLLPSEESMDDAQTNALKVIPSFYCKKGKTVSLPSKGKCPSGASKIKIDKTW